MFKRLFVLLLLTVATLSVSTPAHASTLTITNMFCYNVDSDGKIGGYYACDAFVSDPTATITWAVTASGYQTYYYPTNEEHFQGRCVVGTYYRVSVTARDSTGATASRMTAFWCKGYGE